MTPARMDGWQSAPRHRRPSRRPPGLCEVAGAFERRCADPEQRCVARGRGQGRSDEGACVGQACHGTAAQGGGILRHVGVGRAGPRGSARRPRQRSTRLWSWHRVRRSSHYHLGIVRAEQGATAKAVESLEQALKGGLSAPLCRRREAAPRSLEEVTGQRVADAAIRTQKTKRCKRVSHAARRDSAGATRAICMSPQRGFDGAYDVAHFVGVDRADAADTERLDLRQLARDTGCSRARASSRRTS